MMTLHDKVKMFLNVELKMISPCDEQVKSSIEQGILDYGCEEEYELAINEWLLWHTNVQEEVMNSTQSFVESNIFDSINTFAVANPTLCIAALQGVTHLEEGLQIHLNSTTNEIEVFFEEEHMGEISIKDGSVDIKANNFSILLAAVSHIQQFFPGIWK
jgi:hypothetical protein